MAPLGVLERLGPIRLLAHWFLAAHLAAQAVQAA
jgi:hypothetical protein